MALSNIRNEPRREITEQLIGVVLIGLFFVGDYAFMNWAEPKSTADFICGLILFPILFFLAGIALVGLFLLTHALGELGCNLLAKAGVDPRPAQRYRR